MGEGGIFGRALFRGEILAAGCGADNLFLPKFLIISLNFGAWNGRFRLQEFHRFCRRADHMASKKDEVIKMINQFLDRVRQHHDVRAAYLFGSFAKRTDKEYSDVDLAIVLSSKDISAESPFEEEFRIFHEAQEFNSLLEVVCLGQDEFDRNGGALVQRIKKEGIRII
jgi:predicted nucleotidyltransferase